MYGRRIKGRVLSFVYSPEGPPDGGLLLRDVETQSIWSQLKSQAVRGPLDRAGWPVLPSMRTSWKHWKSQHPDTSLVDIVTGGRLYHYHSRSKRNLRYEESPATSDGRPRDTELVLGVAVGSAVKAFPFSELVAASLPIRETIGTQTILVYFAKQIPAAWATDTRGDLLPSVTSYWSAWRSFHPEGDVFHVPDVQKTGVKSSP